MSPVVIEIEFRGERRRVRVDLGPVEHLPARRRPNARRLVLESETSGAESRTTVDHDVSWQAIRGAAEALLSFEVEFSECLRRAKENAP